MNRIFALLLMVMGTASAEPAAIEIPELTASGQIEGNNLTLDLAFTAKVQRANSVLRLANGSVALMDAPAEVFRDLVVDASGLTLRCEERGERRVSIRIAVRCAKEGERWVARLGLPDATIRRIAIESNKDDIDVELPDALGARRDASPSGGQRIAAMLKPGQPLAVLWQPRLTRLSGELVVDCVANLLAAARTGALRMDSLFSFHIAQGTLDKLSFDAPDGDSVTQVRGNDVREWKVLPAANGAQTLSVVLARPQEGTYKLQVEHERALPPLPCELRLAPLAPRGILRASGLVLLGADGATRLVVKSAAGLNQVDRSAFAVEAMPNAERMSPPERSAFAYQFASLPFDVVLSAEDVTTTLQAEERLSLSIADNDLALEVGLDVDVRDAPAREMAIETETGWNVTSVTGANVSDYDVRDENGTRRIHVYFKNESLGRQLVALRLERTLAADATSFAAPRFRLLNARSERGYLALRGELGVTLRAAREQNLREVPTASLPLRVPGAQYAARFKDPDWQLDVGIVREQPSISAEVFDLATFGESAVYGSSLVTYLINGAAVRTLRLGVPSHWRNLEVTGRDVRNWRVENGVCLVSLQEKIVGDYTLLVTHDLPVPYEKGEVNVGGLRALDAANESGYLALAAPPGVALAGETNRSDGLLPIAAEELPAEYASMIKDPVLRAYKYSAGARTSDVAFRRYAEEDLLDQAADLVLLNTRVSPDGEVVTDMRCQVKNATRQYLAVSLPADSRLWSLLVDGAKAQALERGQRQILVPLPRRLDPNDPTQVDLSIASQQPALGWRRTIGLHAPALTARSLYARWTVTPPERYGIAKTSGDLAAPHESRIGLWAFANDLVGFARQLVTDGFGWLVLAAVAIALSAWITFNVSRRAGVSFSTAAACIAGIVIVTAGARVLPFDWPASFLSAPAPGPLMLSKTVSLAEGGLTIDVTLEKLGVQSARTWLVAIASLALLGFAVRKFRAQPIRFGVIATLAIAVASHSPTLIHPAATLLVLGVIAAGAWAMVRKAREVGARRRVEMEPLPPAAEFPPAEPQQNGFADVRVLLLVAAAACASLAWAAKPAPSNTVMQARAPDVEMLVMDRAKAEVLLPGPGTNGASAADVRVDLDLTFRVEARGDYPLLPGRCLLTGFQSDSRHIEIVAANGGYCLRARRGGEHRLRLQYRVPAAEANGSLSASLWLPPFLVNSATLKLPSANWIVDAPSAAYLRQGEGAEAGTARLVATGTESPLTWRPRARVASLESASYFVELETVARVQPGLVNLTHLAHFQIAQGELRALKFEVPSGTSVTSVSGESLGTWRFDPASRTLEAVISKPVTGEYTLRVVTQLAEGGLPYQADIQSLVVPDASRQRGVIAVITDDGVQVTADAGTGAAAMYPGDFPAEALRQESAGNASGEVKRAYRYQQPPASIRVSATKVEPELRVAEDARVDVTDERVVLTSRLSIDIAKAGIFTAWLELPDGFDVDALSGDDVEQWDEEREQGHRVAVRFSRQAQGTRHLNVVISRQERGQLDELELPRISVHGALKQNGTLAVSAERGLRLSTLRREGAAELNPRDLGLQEAGALAFRILRPEWSLRLKVETAQPVVKSEVVQRVTISEGLMQAKCRVVYSIEHAGVKTFYLRAPRPDIALVVTGPGLARVQSSAQEAGLWEIELQSKREGALGLDVAYQMPYDASSGRADIPALRCEKVDGQKGYIAVFAGGRLEVASAQPSEGLEPEDARAVPARLGAGDLSAAALCFRATRADVSLPLKVTRHDTAEVLAARVESVELTSVLSEDGSMATHALLKLDNSVMRFLSVTLPEKSDVWSAYVNGRAVKPLGEAGRLLVPMTAAIGGTAEVELTFGVKLSNGWFGRRSLPGPVFDLPLQNVTWDVYVPAGPRYCRFDGTMEYREEAEQSFWSYSPEQYEELHRGQATEQTRRASEVLKLGKDFSDQGRQAEARQALEEAIAYSQSDKGLNEDARIQFKSWARQQAVVGLAARRSAMKIQNNVAQQQDLEQAQRYNAGNFDSQYGRQVQQTLGSKENDSLEVVADKILDQQIAAGGDVHPVRVTLPTEGRRLSFHRELQVKPNAPLFVSFSVGSGALARTAMTALTGAILAATFAGLVVFLRSTRTA